MFSNVVSCFVLGAFHSCIIEGSVGTFCWLVLEEGVAYVTAEVAGAVLGPCKAIASSLRFCLVFQKIRA